MCGDGTNDVAALKSSHIGIALLSNLIENQSTGYGGILPNQGFTASIAAPFSSNQLLAVENVIRQGRSVLAATFQMYKILAINCLLSAFSLSVLVFEGIKFGDT